MGSGCVGSAAVGSEFRLVTVPGGTGDGRGQFPAWTRGSSAVGGGARWTQKVTGQRADCLLTQKLANRAKISLLQKVVHEHAVVPAHSPHAPLQPPPTPSTSMRPMLNVGRRVVSHQHLKDATTLVLSLLRNSNQRQSHLRRQDDLTRALSLAGGPC